MPRLASFAGRALDRIAADPGLQRDDVDELVGLAAQLIGDHRRYGAMKYQIIDYDWPVEHHAPIPVGTVIDTDQSEWAWLKYRPPPINAMAMDQQAYDVLRRRYPY